MARRKAKKKRNPRSIRRIRNTRRTKSRRRVREVHLLGIVIQTVDLKVRMIAKVTVEVEDPVEVILRKCLLLMRKLKAHTSTVAILVKRAKLVDITGQDQDLMNVTEITMINIDLALLINIKIEEEIADQDQTLEIDTISTDLIVIISLLNSSKLVAMITNSNRISQEINRKILAQI